jgi:hypothetical protein
VIHWWVTTSKVVPEGHFIQVWLNRFQTYYIPQFKHEFSPFAKGLFLLHLTKLFLDNL